jgi:hypothetical protein
MLDPREIAGLDREEGDSLNFTCGEGAATLRVEVGNRDTLMDLQPRPLRKTAAE